MNKKLLVIALVCSILPAVIVGALSSFGFTLLAIIICTAGGYFGYLLGIKIRDYAPVTMVFGKNQIDLAKKKFFAEYGSQISGFIFGIFCPFIILTAIGRAWGESNSNSSLKDEHSGAISSNMKKIIKENHAAADQDITNYGEFKFKTAVQSATINDSSSHGIQVVLRYEPKSGEYAKRLSTQFIPSMLQKPIMQPLEKGIGFDGSDIGYGDNNLSYLWDFSGKGDLKDWKQETYSIKKEYDYVDLVRNEFKSDIAVPILVFADTIRNLDIDPILYMDDSYKNDKDRYNGYNIGETYYYFSYPGYDEAYKNYSASNEYIKTVLDFIVTGKRMRDSYGTNLDDWLDWNKYFYVSGTTYGEMNLTARADYDHWYFDHNKQGTETDYKAFGEKYATVGILTQYTEKKLKLEKLVELYVGNVYDSTKLLDYYSEIKNNKPSTTRVRKYNDPFHLPPYEPYDELQQDYDYKFKQYVIEHWGDYPDTFKLHREFDEKSYQTKTYWNEDGSITSETEKIKTNGDDFYEFVMTEKKSFLDEIVDAFAKENRAEMLAAYDKKVEETFSQFYNIYIDERTKIFKTLIDLSMCKVYIDYKCLAAADNRETLTAITDKRGVIAYKAQIEPGKWVDAECYFTLRDEPNNFLWR